jgi:CelD/BcsL family acetyltransferase involved in cellulose biosynthesis
MNQPALEARVYKSIEALEPLRADWEKLLSEFPTATTFSTMDWLIPWWRSFGNGQQLQVIAFFDVTQRLVALAPLSITTRAVAGGLKLKLLRFMGDGSGDSDNLDLPVLPGYEQTFVNSLLDLLPGLEMSWDICELNTLPSNSPAASVLLTQLGQREYSHFTFQRPQLVIHFSSDWGAYIGQLTNENRNNLERYTRRLHRRYEVQFFKCKEEADLKRCLDDLFCLHQKRWQLRGESGTFASAERRTFYYNLSRALLEHENLDLWLLALNGKTVAVQFCFRQRDSVFLLQEGFDPEHAADRVGFVLRGHVLKELIAAGVRHYDFLFGQSPGKARWAPQLQYYEDIHFAKRLSRGGLYLALMNQAQDSKKWFRAHLPKGAWALLHNLNVRLGGAKKADKPINTE